MEVMILEDRIFHLSKMVMMRERGQKDNNFYLIPTKPNGRNIKLPMKPRTF